MGLNTRVPEIGTSQHKVLDRGLLRGIIQTVEKMKHAVTALLFHPTTTSLILGVSRKDDPNDFGLPGGKLDPDETWEQALVREVKEETGIVVTKYAPILENVEEYKGVYYLTRTYVIFDVKSYDISYTEQGVVSWVKWSKLTDSNSSFHNYNRVLYKLVAGVV